MRIRLLTSLSGTSRAGGSFSLAHGSVVEVGALISAATAQRLIDSGQAEPVEALRTATVTAPERATAPRKRARRKLKKE